MKSVASYIIVGLVCFIMGLMVGLPSCERKDKAPSAKVISIDTTRRVKIELLIPDPVIIEKPTPVYITKYIQSEPDPPDFELDLLRTYTDTARFSALKIGYNIQTRGTLESLEFAPQYERETVYETVTIREREEAKPIRGLYLGVAIGGNKSQFGTLAPGLDYVAPRVIIGANYNLIDATINVRVGRKLF